MRMQDRSTPLFVAAQEGHLGVLKALLGVHANVEAAKTVSGALTAEGLPACLAVAGLLSREGMGVPQWCVWGGEHGMASQVGH